MRCVAVVDSGVGGLTILRQLQKQHCGVRWVYVADHACCPYGTKSNGFLAERARRIVRAVVERFGACDVVFACNTLACFAHCCGGLGARVHQIVLPTCRHVADLCPNGRVALLATNSTVANGLYAQYLGDMGIATVSFACSSFVPFVERAATNSAACHVAVANALRLLPRCNVDAVVLGCTHFPLLLPAILPHVGCATVVACQPPTLPLQQQCCTPQCNVASLCLTTGNVAAANVAAAPFGVTFAHVDL